MAVGTSQPTRRSWLIELLAGEAQLRCAYARRGIIVETFTVQLEIRLDEVWKPVVRYDNAHGFCHRDTLHADGTQEKTRVFVGNINETFTYAIEDLRLHWKSHRVRFLTEIEK
jgi:hypothetical protein